MPRGVYLREGKTTDVNIQSTVADVEIPLEGSVNREDLQVREVEVHGDMVGFNDKARMLAFMEEPVDVFLHESSNPNDEPAVFLQVSGEPAQPHNPWLIRGRQYTLKRKFLAQLISAKSISYSQPFKNESASPEKVNFMRPQMGMRYPFSIVRDANPEGAKWISQMMGR